MKQKLKELTKESLENLIIEMTEWLSEEQFKKLEAAIEACTREKEETVKPLQKERMSKEFVEEKMKLLKAWMKQIDENELYLDVEEYEEYSDSYWDRDWVTEYYDNQEIGSKIEYMIRFAQDCVYDRKYQEANEIYEWLWEMAVSTDPDYECEPVDLEGMAENKIISENMEELALLTLYTVYQLHKPEKRAETIYLYFSIYTFQKLHIQDMFWAGREKLDKEEQFWKDWIMLLQTKSGEAQSRLLQEAVLYHEGLDKLVETADRNCNVYPSLYLSAMQEYDKKHNYLQIERIGERAVEKVDASLKIRSRIALMAAFAASCLGHTEKQMQFCWECFRSDSTDRNLLRLFGTKEMAQKYGLNAGKIHGFRTEAGVSAFGRNQELEKNWIDDYSRYTLDFYAGNFEKVKAVSKNPKGSLGWSGGFIRYGIRLMLLYLYEKPLPSKAAAGVAAYVGFADEKERSMQMDFESEIAEESRKCKISLFWNYFERWKSYFPVSEEEKKSYFLWAEKIVYSRADAIVSGQHRRHYKEVAELLALAAEIKESMGKSEAKQMIFQEYKKKFPRHSSFQAEMKYYFGI